MNNNLGKAQIRRFHRRLHAWYAKNGRKSLPWRNTRDPYAIYISEIMLQQTQVKTVLARYYFPFLKRFPTLSALAKAPRKDVLKAWEGLGYYNRAINLHNAAKQCVANSLPCLRGRVASGASRVGVSCGQDKPYGGTPPSDSPVGESSPPASGGRIIEELLTLPGVGKNTAHAIAAFAYAIQVPVMEANVKRILCRLNAEKYPLNDKMWALADTLLDSKNPFDYNQAMMDIGAMVCTKRAPKCAICPVSGICRGKDAPEQYPQAIAKKKTPVRRKHIVVLQNVEGKYFALPRQTRFLNGLYQFSEHDKPAGNATRLGHIRQKYSHFTLEAEVYLAHKKSTGKDWYSLKYLRKLPFSAAEYKILDLLAAAQTAKKRLASV